jgi:hypothetical protein
MAVDWRWQSAGGILLDGRGDIAFSGADGSESLADMVRTRLKADLTGWQNYTLGADLASLLGSPVNAELEARIQRQVTASLTDRFLPRGSFQVQTLPAGGRMRVLVYVNQQLLASATLDAGGAVTVQ